MAPADAAASMIRDLTRRSAFPTPTAGSIRRAAGGRSLRSPRPVRSAEHAIPELTGHAEVARLARVMVQRMAMLAVIEIRARADAPMMKHVMYADVPDIAQHQSRGDPTGEIEAGFPPQWKQCADADRRQAQPGRRAHEPLRILMMQLVHCRKEPDPVQHPAMDGVFQ